MKSYVPEWKLYLWKKLLLDQNDPERVFRPMNFVFFTEQQQRGLTLAHMQKMTDAIQDFVYRTRMGVGGQMVETYDNVGTQISDQYYKSEPQQILLALIELAKENPPCLEIKDIELRRYILDKYLEERRRHVSMQERKSLGAGHGRGSFKPDNYLTDPFCGLPEHIYKKVDADEKLTLEEFEELIRKIPGETVYSSICFKMQIDKPALETKLNTYLHDFEAGDLTAPHGAQYFDPQLQRKSVYAAIKVMTANFGTKNLKVTPEKIEAYGAWEKGIVQYYRIFETLFSLEKTGELSIKNILESEVTVSLADDTKSVKGTPEIGAMQNAARENFDREYNSFGIKKEVVEQARQSSEHRELIKTVTDAVAESISAQQPKPDAETEKEILAPSEIKKQEQGNLERFRNLFNLKKPFSWDEIHIRFYDENTVTVHRNETFLKRCSYEECGFGYMAAKGKKVRAWQFLMSLSVCYPDYKKATVENLSKSLGIGLDKKGKNLLEATKRDCRERLSVLFDKNDDAFANQPAKGSGRFYYEPNFHLYPLPELRRQDPVNLQGKDFNESYQSKNHRQGKYPDDDDFSDEEPETDYLKE